MKHINYTKYKIIIDQKDKSQNDIKMEFENNQTNDVINKCNKCRNKYLIVMDK